MTLFLRFMIKSLVLLAVLFGFASFALKAHGVSLHFLPLSALLKNLTLSTLLEKETGLFILLLMTTFGSYLLGSIPFGLLLTKLNGQKDLRTIGSGNIGATNVLRTGNKALAALTLFFDGFKGAVCILIVQSDFFITSLTPIFQGLPSSTLPSQEIFSFLAASSALIGHLYPVWLSYKGGKGIATLAGLLLSLSFVLWCLAILSWILVFWRTKISSVAAIVALIVSPLSAFLTNMLSEANMLSETEEIYSPTLTLWLLGASILLLWRHKDNIKRLFLGKEGQIASTSS